MAKSKVKKGFLFYLFIFVAIVLGVICILGTILIFNPGEDIYGINLRFVIHNDSKQIYRLPDDRRIGDVELDKVEFNSEFTSFNIQYKASESFPYVYFYPSVTALSRSEKVDFKIDVSLVGKTLKIDMTEPELWIGFSANSCVTLVCPKDATFENLAFDINTKSGSVSLGDTSKHTHKIKELDISTETGAITIYDNVNIVSGKTTITTKESVINYTNKYTTDLTITNQKGKVKIPKINGNLSIINTERLEANCGTIPGDLFLESESGFITVDKLGIDNSNGNLTTVNNCKLTNITIKEMTGNALVDLTEGYLVIEKIDKRADIKTTNGNVEIQNINDNITVSTQNGSVLIYQNNTNATTSVATKKGKITTYLANIGNVKLETENSDIEINIVTGQECKIVYETKNGITASWLTSEIEKSGTLFVSGATDSTQDVITAKAPNGKINIIEK